MGDARIRPSDRKRQHRKQWLAALLCVALSVAGCGGGSGGGGGGSGPPPPPAQVTITGVVQKGLFTTLDVTAAVVSEAGEIGTPIGATISDQQFSITVAANSLILLQAGGEFQHDLSGQTVVLDEPLTALVMVGTGNQSVNINLATHLVAARTLADLAAAPQNATALITANANLVSVALGFPAGTNPNALAYGNIGASSDINDPDLLLLLFAASVSNALDGDSLFADGFGIIVDAFVAAQSSADVADVLQLFAGTNPELLYARIADGNFAGALPTLSFGATQIYSCQPGAACAYAEQLNPVVTVGGRTIFEATGGARVAVRLSVPFADAVDARVYSTDLTAEQFNDYVGIDQTLTFPAGTTEIWTTLPVLIDAVTESTESFQVQVESLSPDYASSTDLNNVVIRDGAPAGLANQDAAELEILSVCVKAIGLATAITSDDCAPVFDTTEPLGLDPSVQAAVQIDLAASCASSTDCAPQAHDWLVHFFLVSSGGNELYLGPYVYRNDSVQLTSDAARPRDLLLSFGTPETASFLSDAIAAGREAGFFRKATAAGQSVQIEARVGAPPSATFGFSLPELIPVPGSVIAGNLVIPLGDIDAIVRGDGGTCALGTFELSAEFIVGQDVNGSGPRGSVCVTIVASGGTYTTTLVSGSVDLVGSIIDLAPGNNTRWPEFLAPSSNLPLAFYEAAILVLGTVDANGNPIDNRLALHVDGLPFMFEISGATLSASGIELAYDGVRYVMDVGYSPQDPRARGELYSNDIFYSGLKGQSGVLQLGADRSINGTINVAAGDDHTAFPRGVIAWTAFSQDIVSGRIASNATMNVAFGLEQSSACREPGCAAGDDLYYGLNTVGTVIDPQGFSLGSGQIVDALPVIPGWGADAAGNLAFSRGADLAAPNGRLTMALPGYRFPATGQGRVSDYLLAHIAPAGGTPGLGVHPLGSSAANDGNFYPTGLTVGPETYRDAQGQPVVGSGQDLGGKPLDINNGADSASLPASIAAKYVVRNAGITGVFNIDPAGLQTPLQFYGYSFEFDRFALRLVDNELDPYNWIDGSLLLNGDAGGSGGLELFFANLQMNCSARFDAANLLLESCDAADNNGNGLVDENCGHRLDSWRADTEIFSMGFDSGAACATGNQLLTLEQQVFFKALDGPIGLTAKWQADGTLDSYASSVQAAYRLDETEQRGFPVRAQSARIDVAAVPAADNGRYGYAELRDTTVGVPFWNAINGDVRIANQFSFGSPAPEPTVMAPVVAANQNLGNLDPAKINKDLQQLIIDDKARDLTARFEWGNTNFGFQLPVYYSPQAFNSERSQFIGRQKQADLFVLEANAGINFIDPERTKLSFGASADIAKLQSVNLQLDLGDPDNLRKVDNLLIKFKIIKRPVLEPMLQELLDKLSIVNRLANKGLDELMQKGLELALEELGQAAAPVSPYGEDPFVTASKALAQVMSYPQQVMSILDDEIKGRIDAALQDQQNNLAQKLLTLKELVSNNITANVDVPANVKSSVDDAIALLESVHAEADAVSNTLTNSLGDVRSLIDAAENPLDRADGALAGIDQILLQAVTFSETACRADGGLIGGQEASGYLDQIVIRIGTVRKVFELIGNDDLLLPLTELLNNDPELRQRIEQTRRDIQTQAEELAGYLDAADQAIRSVACNDRFAELLADARTLVSDTRIDVGAIRGILVTAGSKLQQAEGIKDIIANAVLPPIAQLTTLLHDFRDRLDSRPTIGGAQLFAELEADLAAMTGGDINKFVADPNNPQEKDVLKLVFELAQAEINTKYGELRAALEVDLLDKLAGAYFSPEQLRRLFVSLIMDSQPVADLRTLMNMHFNEINYRVNNLVLLLTDQINSGIRAALNGVESEINDALESAFAPVKNIPLQSAKLDGFAIIAGNDLERAHIGAEWTMRPAAEGQSANTFGAALDAVSWSASNKAAGCSIGADDGRLDVTISALGIPAKFIGSEILLKKLYLGFTLGSGNGTLIPRGVFGGVSTSGEIGFSEAIIYDPAFAAGIGDIETYIGASAGAVFSDIQAEVAFLVGRTCNKDILNELDPRIAEFITFPDTGFKGVYMRGGASIPLLTFGCPLTVGLGADFGAWVLAGPPTTFGGLVGGGAYGKVACVGALRGQILAIGQVNTDGELFFAGEGFGAAGAGMCDPASWTSVQRVREDSFCGTGDAIFRATFDNGKWLIPKPKITAIK